MDRPNAGQVVGTRDPRVPRAGVVPRADGVGERAHPYYAHRGRVTALWRIHLRAVASDVNIESRSAVAAVVPDAAGGEVDLHRVAVN